MKINPELQPYDPMCGRYAKDMDYLDGFIVDNEAEPYNVTPLDREVYVRAEEGTYNPVNGHFLCDTCYIKAGMPSNSSGKRWVCP